MTRQERWVRLLTAIKKDIPAFNIRFKDQSSFQRLIGYLSFWNWSRDATTGARIYGYMEMTTTIGNCIYFPYEGYVNTSLPAKVLEHEWVHMKDARTFFSLLPFLPSIINQVLFNLCYLLIFPWPGVTRAYAEIRAYRRSLELTDDSKKEENLKFYVEQFTGPSYFYMWPFPKQVERLLQKPSPYCDMMNRASESTP